MAALAIVVVHVFLVTEHYSESIGARMLIRLDVCVSLFFMLSAFLLYRPMIAHRSGGPRGPSTREYARRRFFRIYPAYWFALTCLAIVPGLAGVFSDHWWSFYSLYFNYEPGSTGSDCLGTLQLCGLPQTWTLATEITFYALLPLYAYLAARLVRRSGKNWPRTELILIGVLIAISIALYLIPGSPRHEPWFRFSFFGHFDWLGLGLALAVASVALERRPSLPQPLAFLSERPGWSYGAALAVYLVMVFALPPIPFPLTQDVGTYLAMHLGHAIMAVLIMVPVVFGSPNVGRSRRFLGHPALVWLGVISYGMYLWHFSIAYKLGVGGADGSFWPVLVLTLALAIPLGAVNWYAVEKPMMRFKYGKRAAKRRRAASKVPP
jgi:peptidoglycan/LPS O-acetylase OafA/YrhL